MKHVTVSMSDSKRLVVLAALLCRKASLTQKHYEWTNAGAIVTDRGRAVVNDLLKELSELDELIPVFKGETR